MKRFALAILIIACFSIPSLAKYSGGSGEPNDPYQIGNVEDLLALRNNTEDYGKCFILTHDLDLESIDLDPEEEGIQGFKDAVIARGSVHFKGIFDGNNHTISNLVINGSSQFCGLFGTIDSESAVVKNLGILNPDIFTYDTAGALIGQMENGTVTNCYVHGGRVRGESSIGGLIGYNAGYMENCWTDCDVNGTNGSEETGGLTGINVGDIHNCHSNGNVSGTFGAGGFAGNSYGLITDSYSTGNVTGSGDGIYCTGGFIGWIDDSSRDNGTLINCYATGTVTGVDAVGGFIGVGSSDYISGCFATGPVCGRNSVGGFSGGSSYLSYCYATGHVKGNNSVGGLTGNGGSLFRCYATGNVDGNNYVGGLTGSHGEQTIDQCFATGDVNGIQYVGGLVGHLYNEEMSQLVSSYAMGNVTGENYVGGLAGYIENEVFLIGNYSAGKVNGISNVGGLIGYADGGTTNLSFWDINTSGQTLSAAGEGKTTAEMQTKDTFLATWGFWALGSIWLMTDEPNYPQLRWTVPDGWYGGGTGEPNNPYRIIDASTFMAIYFKTEDYNKCFILVNDIDLDPNLPGNRVFGNSVISIYGDETYFSGVFDGNGHAIRNLVIGDADVGADSYLALFGYVSHGRIQNLRLENLTILGFNYNNHIAGLVAYNDHGDLSNCSLTGTIICENHLQYIGGLVAYNDHGSISNCNSAVTITGLNNLQYVGGLVAYNKNGTISNCDYNSIISSGDDASYIGGLVGYNYEGAILKSSSFGSISWNSGMDSSGGLVGYNEKGIIFSCSSASNLSGGQEETSQVGGLAGYNDNGNIENCFASGAVNGKDASYSLGGLVGANDNSSTINNCYSTGAVIAGYGSDAIGGLAGANYYDCTISNCFSTSAITTGEETYDIGGFLGYYDAGDINDCYFLDVAGPNNSFGTPLTDTQMKQQASFAGWDFVWETTNGTNDLWAICEGVSYPKLAWQFIPGDFDNNKNVDFIDFATLAAKWMQSDSTLYCGGADLTGDGLVDIRDLDAFVHNWLIGI